MYYSSCINSTHPFQTQTFPNCTNFLCSHSMRFDEQFLYDAIAFANSSLETHFNLASPRPSLWKVTSITHASLELRLTACWNSSYAFLLLSGSPLIPFQKLTLNLTTASWSSWSALCLSLLLFPSCQQPFPCRKDSCDPTPISLCNHSTSKLPQHVW